MSETYNEPTYAVFGDVGGHYPVFLRALNRLGIHVAGDSAYLIPENLTIIQLGDLVHKGGYSRELIRLVDFLMKKNNSNPDAGTWIQLVGNHESQYIPGAPTFWPQEVNAKGIKTINQWWQDGSIRLHYVIPQSEGKDFVISHAGISRFLYMKGLASNIHSMSTETFYGYIESLQPKRMKEAAKAGWMLYGKLSSNAGIFWAETVQEVYETWRGLESPFHQIHGHVTPFSWDAEAFYPSVPDAIQTEIVLDTEKRHSIWEHNGVKFYGIDPGFDKNARSEITPLILTHNGISDSR